MRLVQRALALRPDADAQAAAEGIPPSPELYHDLSCPDAALASWADRPGWRSFAALIMDCVTHGS